MFNWICNLFKKQENTEEIMIKRIKILPLYHKLKKIDLLKD